MKLKAGIKKLMLSGFVSLVLLAAMLRLYLNARGEKPGILDSLCSISLSMMFYYFLCTVMQALFRAWRYQHLMSGSGMEGGFADMLLVTLVRNAFVDLVPARAGELSFVGMLSAGRKVAADRATAAMLVSMLFDFISLAALLCVVRCVPVLASAESRLVIGAALAVLSVIVGAGCWLIFFLYPWLMGRTHARLAAMALFKRRFFGKALGFMAKLADAVSGIRRAGLLWRTFLLSVPIRLFKYAGLYLGFLAVTRENFAGMYAAEIPRVISALITAEASASLPIPSFMGFGVYEAGGAAAWAMMGFAAEQAVVAMLVLHIATQVVDYTLGGSAFAIFTFRTGKMRADGVACFSRRAAYVSGAAVAAAAAGIAALTVWHIGQKQGAKQPPPPGSNITVPADDRQRCGALLGELDGFMVWSSNRGGNHDIYRMELPSMEISRLTSHPHAETMPRISHDGKKILFARSRQPWVSQRNAGEWDVFVTDIDRTNERLVAENAFAPSWSGDDSSAYYQLKVDSFAVKDLATGAERVLFKAGEAGLPRGAELQTPDYDENAGLLAVTFRRAVRSVSVVGGGGVVKIGGGCQMLWSPGGKSLYWIDGPGDMKNAVYCRVFPGWDRKLWLDLPAPYSHEYFPKVSSDGKWLVLGASAKGHEHDTADYEIFLWKTGDPASGAVRLTYHTGNDCWPDLFVRRGE